MISQNLSPRNAFANYPGVEPLSCAYESENLQSLSPPSVSLAPKVFFHLQSWHRIIWETVNQSKKYSFSRDLSLIGSQSITDKVGEGWGGVFARDSAVNLLAKETPFGEIVTTALKVLFFCFGEAHC